MTKIVEIVDALRVELDQEDFELQKFERYLIQLHKLEDAAIIRPLLSIFRDDFHMNEVLFSVVHLIEGFDNETYIREVLAGLSELQIASIEWLGILVHRIANDEVCYKVLLRQAQSVSDQRTITALRTAVRELKGNFKTLNGDRLENDLNLPNQG
jgi:hypothetical protein